MTHATVRDLLRTEVVTASPTESIATAAQRMRTECVETVVVATDDDRPVGVLTDHDLAVGSLADGWEPDDHAVIDVVTTTPTVDADAGVDELRASLERAGVRRLPVVDDDERVVGVVGLDALTLLLARRHETLAAAVERTDARW
ncbi:CBS domain-containing protein [Halobaculum sp. MBLA0147]|uniref:CBS domain-containing protein n=1 Tax=Halobaculum sp. MBLA0147 TaxID=3079934 RepID=UPI0035263150